MNSEHHATPPNIDDRKRANHCSQGFPFRNWTMGHNKRQVSSLKRLLIDLAEYKDFIYTLDVYLFGWI